MKVALTHGRFALVDEEDWAKISHHTWQAVRDKGGWVARTNLGRSVRATMQQLIMGYRHGHEIDHRNRNTLDNRRENLRWATRPQNGANRALPNAIGYKGVAKVGHRFRTTIGIGGRSKYLGMYATPEEAHQAYRVAAKEAWGEFACFDCKPRKRKDTE